VTPREERRKVEAAVRDDDDLKIEHDRAVGQSQQAFDESGEVAARAGSGACCAGRRRRRH
jgi:hypothetical protein